ncbi:MAG TPA: hypothetical protein VGF59_19080 [Bryobacteraceae bacterium]|jgi:hypothetical protein
MTFNRLVLALAVAGQLALAADSPDVSKSSSSPTEFQVTAPRMPMSQPPVMRKLEPQDNVVVKLPGPSLAAPEEPVVRRRIVATRPFIQQVAVHHDAPPPVLPAAPALPPAQLKPDLPAVLKPPKPSLPADLERDTALYCQRRIGDWTEAEARKVLGEPIRQRAAFDDDHTESGHIFAFADPTGRYRELELDFATKSGRLRTVFVYPWKLTWQECRKVWGANVNATEANKGRKFYSYVNRRLDVLVDPAGQVISLGLY